MFKVLVAGCLGFSLSQASFYMFFLALNLNAYGKNERKKDLKDPLAKGQKESLV